MSPVIHENERKHFKVGSRKSKLAMAQTERFVDFSRLLFGTLKWPTFYGGSV